MAGPVKTGPTGVVDMSFDCEGTETVKPGPSSCNSHSSQIQGKVLQLTRMFPVLPWWHSYYAYILL